MATEEKKEAFLDRWSRRKQESKDLPAKDDKPAPTVPPVEKLTPESDFSGFMHPKVDDALRRLALKKLFNDPHFNVPDPFEAYSGDWTVGEPISQEMLAALNQAQQLLFADKKKEDTPAPQAEEVAEKPKPDGKQDA